MKFDLSLVMFYFLVCFYILKHLAAVLEYIAQAGDGKLDGDHPLESGVLDSRCGRGCIPFMEVCSKADSGLLSSAPRGGTASHTARR